MRIVPWLPPLFRDRAAGGRALAEAVAGASLGEVVAVGVARGGVAVAAEVAQELPAPLTAVDVERVNARRLRLGAVTADGPPYLLPGQPVPAEEVEPVVRRARAAARALEARLDHRRLPVAGRVALLVDDGVITGLTLAAACRWARWAGAAKVVAATPVGRPDGIARVAAEADAVVCVEQPDEISVVGQAYEIFDGLDEWYVAGLLRGEA